MSYPRGVRRNQLSDWIPIAVVVADTGVSPAELAKAVGVDPRTAGRWLAGEDVPSADRLAAIEAWLGTLSVPTGGRRITNWSVRLAVARLLWSGRRQQDVRRVHPISHRVVSRYERALGLAGRRYAEPTAKQKQIIELRRDGLTYPEIAARVETSENYVYHTLRHRTTSETRDAMRRRGPSGRDEPLTGR